MGPSRKAQLAEVSVFVLLILPPLVLGIFVSTSEALGFAAAAGATMAQDISLVALIGYFLWRNGEGAKQVGWVRSGVATELVLGALLAIPMILGANLLDVLLGKLGLPGPRVAPTFLQPQGTANFVLAIALVVVVAIAEETLFRGYLLLRLGAVTRSAPWAVVLSSVLFGFGHGYEGVRGMLTVGAVGLFLAVVYLWRKSIIAPVVMHFLLDFFAIVLVPAVRMHGS